MFDGTLAREEPTGESETSVDMPWSWELTLLVLAMASVAILAGVMFPEILGDPGLRF